MATKPARRVVYDRFGEAGLLRVERAIRESPGAGQIAIDVAFAGVNYADILARRGFYKWAPPAPTCVGFEVSGIVSTVGAGVTVVNPGDRVLAVTKFGGYADHVVVDVERAFTLPPSMSLEEGAALPATYLTAWHSLFEVARARKGESVLVQAVAGGVGTAALQLAKHAKLVTFGTASTDEKLVFARGLGLDHPINYAACDFEAAVMELTGGRGVDIVLDSLGGEGLRKGYRCLGRGGRLVTIGAAQVAPESRSFRALASAGFELLRGGVFHPFSLIEDNKSIAGVQILLWWDDVPHLRRAIGEILHLYERSVIRPVIDRVLPLEDAAAAHEHLERRRSRGKVLLRAA